MKTETAYLAVSSLAALASVAIASYQVVSPSAGKTPVEVSLRLEDAKAKPEIGSSHGKEKLADSRSLLRNIRASLAMIGTATVSHRSGGLVVKFAGEAARFIEQLEAALNSGQPGKISAATANASRSVAKLKSAYALVPERSERLSAGMRGVVANWSVYAARYTLASPPPTMNSIAPAQASALRQEVAKLSRRVALLEKQTAQNRALSREVLRVRTELVYYERSADSYQSYQAMLLTLSMVSGAFDAFLLVTRDCYPRYYLYFEPYLGKTRFWESYWSAYYDGYYAREDAWYTEAFAVPDRFVLVPTEEMYSYQDIGYQQIIQISAERSITLDSLPREDLSDVEVPALPEEVALNADRLADFNQELTQPSSVERQTVEKKAAQDQERQLMDDPTAISADERAATPEPSELHGTAAVEMGSPEPSAAETTNMEEPSTLGDDLAGQTGDDASAEEQVPPSIEEPFTTEEPFVTGEDE
jgi:hypothetical protein